MTVPGKELGSDGEGNGFWILDADLLFEVFLLPRPDGVPIST
jgi:hypothetical protein